LSVVTELNSIYDVLKANYPTAKIARQDVPTSPVANTFVVRLQYADSKTETRSTFINSREFQLIYFGTSSVDVITKADELNKSFNNDRLVIPIRGSLRYMRVKAFSYGTAFKSAGGVDAVIAVLQTETREARDLPTYEKIKQVGVMAYTDKTAGTWGIIDGSDTPNPYDGFTFDDIESGKTILGKE
jgi:hypothetical protein